MIVLLFTVTVVYPCRIRRTRGCVIAVKSRPASARSRCAGGRATANTRKHECMHEQPRIVDETFSRNDELVSRQDADSAASPLLVLTKGQPAARRRGRGGVRGGGRAGPMTGGLCRGRGGRAAGGGGGARQPLSRVRAPGGMQGICVVWGGDPGDFSPHHTPRACNLS